MSEEAHLRLPDDEIKGLEVPCQNLKPVKRLDLPEDCFRLERFQAKEIQINGSPVADVKGETRTPGKIKPRQDGNLLQIPQGPLNLLGDDFLMPHTVFDPRKFNPSRTESGEDSVGYFERSDFVGRNSVSKGPEVRRSRRKPALVRDDSLDLLFTEGLTEPCDGIMVTILQDACNRVVRESGGIKHWPLYIPEQGT